MYSYILLIFVVIFYAGNILLGKSMNDLSPFTIAFFRLLIALIVLMPIGLRSAWKDRGVIKQYKWPFFIMTLTGVTFFNTFIYGSLQFTSATNVSVLECCIPAVTVVLSAIWIKEKLRKIQWIGVGLSFFGALWVVLDGRITELFSLGWNIGDLIMIGAIGCWAVYSIYVKEYMHLFKPFGFIFSMTALSVIILLPFMLAEWAWTGVPTLYKSEYVWGFLYLGIFPSFFALIFYNRAVEQLGASQASIFLNFLPVATMIGAYFWLGETVTFASIVGAVLVIVGVLFTTQLKRRDKNRRIGESNG